MSVLRPLPPRPSLEYEHKAAKALLRRLRAGDPEALARARARHPAIAASVPIRLADAQLVIAREYGFASWPRLVRWFGDLDRQRYAHRSSMPPGREPYERAVERRLAAHPDRRPGSGRSLAAYVPRFYGMSVEEILASAVTEDDVRLAMARENGFPSWEVLLEHVTSAAVLPREQGLDVDPGQRAGAAIRAADLDALQRVVASHPGLLRPREEGASRSSSLLGDALLRERAVGREAMRPIVDWLVSRGLDLQLELNRQLCGHMRMQPETVGWLLERGADPNWVAPNGIPVLEHALIRYWNGDAVDVLAAHSTPRSALWIAAGLGDVDGVRRSLDQQGRPTASATRLRPDFDAVGPATMPSLPDPDDEELLAEAFLIAMFNGRTAVLEHMASHGTLVNSMIYGSPLISLAVGNAWTPVVECLVRCGADLDIRGWQPHQSPREIAREMFEGLSDDAERRRIVELCGMDPGVVLAERDARPVPPPAVHPGVQEALELAGDDAFRLGQSDIRPENLLFGLLRGGGLPLSLVTRATGLDLDRFRADLHHRMRPSEERAQGPVPPLRADAQAAIDLAVALATDRRRDLLLAHHLLYALTRDGRGAAADLLARYGSSAAMLNAELEKSI